jgi:hypothetical protein
MSNNRIFEGSRKIIQSKRKEAVTVPVYFNGKNVLGHRKNINRENKYK